MTATSANGWDIRRLDEVDSTNRWLLDEARGGAPAGLVAVADHQIAGRGRLGRTWEAPNGTSLLMSVLLRPGTAVARAHLLTAAVALSAADACASVAGVRPGLKWPNDLVTGGRKLGGILAESLLAGDKLEAVVIGLGLNVNWPRDLPPELASIATSLNHHAGHEVDRESLLTAILDGIDRADVVAEYRAACVTLGTEVRVDLGSETLSGVASELSDEGHLGVIVDGTLRWVAAGDVVHVR